MTDKRTEKAQSLKGQTIWIGIGTTLSGSYMRIGTEMKQAAELAIEELNAAGGICGARVSSQTADDRSSARTGEAVAHQFCARADLLGVIGHYSSDVSIAASEIYSHCGLAMITPIASNPGVTDRGHANVFRFTNRDDYTGQAIARYVYNRLGKRRAVVIESEYAYGKSMSDAFANAFLQIGGEVVVRQPVTVGEREFGSLVRVLPKDFDMLFYGGAFEGAFLLKAMREHGLRQLFAAGDGCWDVTNFLKPAGDATSKGEGILVLAATPGIGRVPGSTEFAERYRQRHGAITNYAVNSYDSTLLLLQAVERAAQDKDVPPKREDVIGAIRDIKFQGIAYLQQTEWDAKGDNIAAVTALYTATPMPPHASGNLSRFRQVAEIGRDGSEVMLDRPTATSF